MCVIEDKLLQKFSEFEDTEKKKKSQKTQEKKKNPNT